MNANIQKLCSYISYFENVTSEVACQWVDSEKNDDGAVQFRYPMYEKAFDDFVHAFYESDLAVPNYSEALERRFPDWQTADWKVAIQSADFELVMAMLTKCIRVERFCEGAWDSYIRKGLFLDLLLRLEALLETGQIPNGSD